MIWRIKQIYWNLTEIKIRAKLKKSKNGGVALVKELPDKMDTKNYLLARYAILIEYCPSDPKKCILIFPFIEKYNRTLEYKTYCFAPMYTIYKSEENRMCISRSQLNVVDVLKPTVKQNNYKLNTAQQLAPLIKEHLQIQSEIEELRKQYFKIENLIKLVATSDIYSEQGHTYKIALKKIGTCFNKAEELDNAYTRLIREILIGLQVAEAHFEHLPESNISVDLQYERIQEEYKNMKDVVTAYYQLLKESRNTQF